MTTLLRSRTTTARKVHLCTTCQQPAVQPGEQYERTTYIYDGHFYSALDCTGCRAISGVVYEWCGMPDEGIGMDSYTEWAHEHRADETWGEEARAFIRRLYTSAGPALPLPAHDGDLTAAGIEVAR